jgi:adenylate cyclase
MWKRRLVPVLIGLVAVALLTWLRLADPYAVQTLRDLTFDGYQRIHPREAQDFPVRIIDIDEASLAAIGQWPWPRNLMAEMVQRLTNLGAAAVVVDGLFPEPDRLSPSRLAAALGTPASDTALPDYDEEFAAALADSPSVLSFSVNPGFGPVPDEAKTVPAIVGPNTDVLVPFLNNTTMSLPMLVAAAHGLGSIGLEPHGSVSTIRRLPLLWTNGSALFPSLSIEALRVALGVATPVVFTDQTGFGTVQSVRVGAYEVPTTPEGELWLYYEKTPDNLYVSAQHILGDAWSDYAPLIQGNIVFIGTSAAGLLDIRGTPLGTDMAGVEIHAQALQQILAGDFLQRADWVSGAEILAFLIIAIAIIVVIMATGPLISFFVGAVLLAGVIGASWWAFVTQGILVDPSFPLIGTFVVYTLMTFLRFVITDADKRKIRTAFGNYVDPTLLTQIEKSGAKLQLGGETRELSIMFSDVRNFTTVSEDFTPPALVAMLNTLFGALGACITEQYGTIDKFIGDAIMAFWNAPVDVENHARRACTAALHMRTKLAELNAHDGFRLRADGHKVDEIAIGIGISTGEALVGNLGLETRFDYSCVGDTVNVASRVEGACKTVGYDIVVVEATRAEASDLAFLEAGSLSLKGKTNREPIHILVGDEALAATAEFKALEKAHAEVVRELRNGRDGSDAIARCISLIAFSDPLLAKFYDTMGKRAHDFVLDASDEASVAVEQPA